MEFDAAVLEQVIHAVLDAQILTIDQQFLLDVEGVTLKFKVVKLEVVSAAMLKGGSAGGEVAGVRGVLTKKTTFTIAKAHDSAIRIKGGTSGSGAKPLFRYERETSAKLDERGGRGRSAEIKV